jgi:hypothetical protein
MNLKTLIIALLCPIFMMAQPPISEKKMKQIESQKIAFITTELDLSPEQAQVFWPVYNQYSKEVKSLHDKRREGPKKINKDLSTLSDEKLEEILDAMIEGFAKIHMQEVELKKKYHTEFKKVMTIQQVAILYRSERKFKGELLRRLKQGRDRNHKRKR